MIQFLADTLAYYPIWSSIYGFIAAILLWVAVPLIWTWFQIGRTKTTPIADLSAGYVEIKGRVRALKTMQKFKRRVVYYQAIHERYVSGSGYGYGKNDWNAQKTEEERLPFEVDDGTGKIAIDPERASMDIAQVKITGRNVEEHGAERTRHLYIPDKSPIYVLGNLRRKRGEWRIGKKFGMPFIISDEAETELGFGYGATGFGLATFVLVAGLILCGFAHSNWTETWEGVIVKKYTFQTESVFKRYRTLFRVENEENTHFAVDLKVGPGRSKPVRQTLGLLEWRSVRKGDYLVKKSHQHTIEIRRRR